MEEEYPAWTEELHAPFTRYYQKVEILKEHARKNGIDTEEKQGKRQFRKKYKTFLKEEYEILANSVEKVIRGELDRNPNSDVEELVNHVWPFLHG